MKTDQKNSSPERLLLQPEIRPGALVELSSDWRAELWPVKGGWNGPGASPWQHRFLDGPCTFLVLARIRCYYDQDDLQVLTLDGRVGWTYMDPGHVPGAVPRPRLRTREHSA